MGKSMLFLVGKYFKMSPIPENFVRIAYILIW